MATKIKIDIDELSEVLMQLNFDGFSTVELEIYDSEINDGIQELMISATDLVENTNLTYGCLCGIDYDA